MQLQSVFIHVIYNLLIKQNAKNLLTLSGHYLR